MNRITYHTEEAAENYKTQLAPQPEVWDWVKNTPDGDIHIFEDNLLKTHVNYNGKIKIASPIECPAVYDYCASNNPNQFHPYRWLENNHQHFDYIISPYTFLKEVVGNKYIWMPVGGSRIRLEDFGLYEKSNLLSIVASHKTWTQGHRLRHEIIKRYPGKIDAYGSGYNSIIDDYEGGMGKIIGIGPYAYSFAVMNSKIDNYFTEILTDVMAAGTIPIWWGTPEIKHQFNMDGVISFNTLEELDVILPTLTLELYQSKLPAILDNIERSKKYITRFDWIYNYKKPFFETL